MLQSEARYDFVSILLHWITAILIFVQLAIIWFLRTTPQNTNQWNFYFNLHLLIGTISFLVALFWIVYRFTHKPPAYPTKLSDGQRYLAFIVYFLLYACLLLLPLSGFLQLEFGESVTFLGLKLHFWADQNDSMYALFNTVHIGLAYLVIGLIVVHFSAAIYHLFRRSGIFSRMLLSFSSPSRDLKVVDVDRPSRKYQLTSTNFLIFGWLAFLFQVLIAIITILLLAFATSGEQPAPGVVSGNEESIFWAQCGLISLFVTIIFFFSNARYAIKIKTQLDTELRAHKTRTLNLLRCGLFSGFAGIFIAILGVGESIKLLIAKTISQPPGIAITDPSKIVRALDIFVLVSNFAIVIAHFVGIIISLWLLNRVDRNF